MRLAGADPVKDMGVHMYVHRIIFAKQSKLVGIIHAYTPVIRFRSDYEQYVRV
jgi:hypothetical protein